MLGFNQVLQMSNAYDYIFIIFNLCKRKESSLGLLNSHNINFSNTHNIPICQQLPRPKCIYQLTVSQSLIRLSQCQKYTICARHRVLNYLLSDHNVFVTSKQKQLFLCLSSSTGSHEKVSHKDTSKIKALPQGTTLNYQNLNENLKILYFHVSIIELIKIKQPG